MRRGPRRPAEEVADRVDAVARALCRYPYSVWHYGEAIGLEGLLAAAEVLGDARYEAYVDGAMKAWAPRAEPFRELDNTAPGHVLCLVIERTGDEHLLALARRLARFLVSRPTMSGCYVSFARAPLREPFGGSPLPEAERELLAEPGPGVFVDCLHLDAPFLAHLGRLDHDGTLPNLAAAQASAMVDLLQDADSGIFYHFALERTGERYGFGWSRGQGWALLGLLDVLDFLPETDERAPALRDAVSRLATAIVETQDETGHWPGLLHEPSAFLETSAAFFFACGLARGVRRGLFPSAWMDVARR
ncbi:MAG: glycoside hydrolase family 88 protein, partial [Gaiellaceae bacterium]|nr:glycoside hydrolase family 88 protein [Gaiellaceae bacterium]